MSAFREKAYRAYCRLYRTVRGERAYRQWLFQKIYRQKQWIPDGDESDGFHSGPGSRGEPAAIYVDRMGQVLSQLRAELGRPLTIVDLGCGDFEVGARLLEHVPDSRYTGCDIVPELVSRNNERFGNARVAFRVVDLVSDPLPAGDVCLVRQVLQHLSNAHILAFIDRADYDRLYVTEGHPVVRSGPTNPDKEPGETVRFNWLSGQGGSVELDKAPFSRTVETLFEARLQDHEIIRTQRIV